MEDTMLFQSPGSEVLETEDEEGRLRSAEEEWMGTSDGGKLLSPRDSRLSLDGEGRDRRC